MTRTARPRHQFALVLAAALPLLLAACSDSQYPNSTFTNLTDINRDAGSLWNLMIWLGIAVFVFVELLLVYMMIRYRRTPESAEPEHVHGNTTLELDVDDRAGRHSGLHRHPDGRTIFAHAGARVPNALQVEVIGHSGGGSSGTRSTPRAANRSRGHAGDRERSVSARSGAR